MSPDTLSQSKTPTALYLTLPEAIELICAKKTECAYVFPAWQKLEHAKVYLEKQISELWETGEAL